MYAERGLFIEGAWRSRSEGGSEGAKVRRIHDQAQAALPVQSGSY